MTSKVVKYTDNPKYKKKAKVHESWELSINEIVKRQSAVRQNPAGESSEDEEENTRNRAKKVSRKTKIISSSKKDVKKRKRFGIMYHSSSDESEGDEDSKIGNSLILYSID